jgi:hypothetical protein
VNWRKREIEGKGKEREREEEKQALVEKINPFTPCSTSTPPRSDHALHSSN